MTGQSENYDELAESYDAIIMGTGLTECILSGLLSVDGKKVLHVDRNDYYGAECASLNLTQFYKKFRTDETPPEYLGKDRDWNVDLTPKFMMAEGEITNMLTHTDVTRYLTFTRIDSCHVYTGKKTIKVPATPTEALRSSLCGFLEKRYLQKFLEWVNGYKDNDPSTHRGINIDKDTMAEVYKKFGVGNKAQQAVGQAMALHLNDEYLQMPARDTVEKVKQYAGSVLRFGKSPFIYPLYGLGDLPQAFARLSAVYGGTYMLNTDVKEILYNNQGEVKGVMINGKEIKTNMVICDPSYNPLKVEKTGTVIRAYCLLKAPIPDTNSDCCQIVVFKNEFEPPRKNDVYVTCLGSSMEICPKGYYMATISTIAETGNNPEDEIHNVLKSLGPKFFGHIERVDYHELPIEKPTDDGKEDHVYVSRSYDATSHFETICDDVKDMWKRITGEELVLKKGEPGSEAEAA